MTTVFYTEQMDAEDLGRKLLLTPFGDPCRTPEMQIVGTVTASRNMLTLQALSSSLNAGTAKWGCLGRGEAFGCPPAVCPPERPHPFARYRHLTLLKRGCANWVGLGLAENQEWPRQTKPKKGQFINFSQGHSRTKVRNVNRACFPKEKHQNSQKMGELHKLFVLALSLVWFAGATLGKFSKFWRVGVRNWRWGKAETSQQN